MKPFNIENAREISNKYPEINNQISAVNSAIIAAAHRGEYMATIPGALREEVEVAFFEAGYEVTRISNTATNRIEYYIIKW